MKIEIEQYKGQTLYYDDDTDKFLCDMTSEDNFRQTKRGSLKDLRKEVDAFIKANLDFKPFKVIHKRYDDFKVATVSNIRTDGKLVIDGVYGKTLIEDENRDEIMGLDLDLIEEYQEAERAYNLAQSAYNDVKKSILARLQPMDLSKYDLK